MAFEIFTDDRIYFLLSPRENMDYDTLENTRKRAKKLSVDEPIFIAQVIELLDACQEGLSRRARFNEWTLKTLKEERKTIVKAFKEHTDKLLDEFGITIDDLKLLDIEMPKDLDNDN